MHVDGRYAELAWINLDKNYFQRDSLLNLWRQKVLTKEMNLGQKTHGSLEIELREAGIQERRDET